MLAFKKSYLSTSENPNTAAVVSYITVIGWFYAYFAIYKKNKTLLAAFHLRQSLLLHMALILSYLALNKANTDFLKTLDILWFAIWFWGFIDAVKGRRVPVPFIGFLAQLLFKGI